MCGWNLALSWVRIPVLLGGATRIFGYDDSCNFAVVLLRFTEIKKYFPKLTPMFVSCTKINTQSCYLEVQGMEDSLLGFSGKHWKVCGKKKK